MALSDTKLRRIIGKPYTGEPELSDRDGLSVRVSVKGKITWQYRFRFNRKPARISLGRYPDLSIKDARNLIPEVRGIVDKGLDPRLVWRTDYKGPVDIITASTCIEQFLKVRVPKLKDKSKKTYTSVLTKYYANSFPEKPIESVKHNEWLDFLDRIGTDNPKLSASVLSVGKTCFRWCVRRKLINYIPLLDIVTSDVGVPPEKGERVLSINEIKSIWLSTERTQGSVSTCLAIKLCILFGCRQIEIIKARREHFDMKERIWSVPKELSKTNQIIRRPITHMTEKIIRHAWDIYGEGGYLLPSELKDDVSISANAVHSQISRIRDTLRKSKEVTSYWRGHDFRRTLSTRLSEMAVLPHVTEKMLGHALTGVMAVYNKHDWIKEQRAAYELWSNTIIPE